MKGMSLGHPPRRSSIAFSFTPQLFRAHRARYTGLTGQTHFKLYTEHYPYIQKNEYLAVIMTYIPNKTQWSEDFIMRIE